MELAGLGEQFWTNLCFLTNADTNFVGRSTPEDVREWAIGMANSFRPQLMELNRSMMSADWSRVGPYVENGELKFPDYTGNLTDVNTNLIVEFYR